MVACLTTCAWVLEYVPRMCEGRVFGGDGELREWRPACRAVCDNGVHALVGLCCWISALALEGSRSLTFDDGIDLGAVGVLSSAIDLDHFLAAGEASLEAATRLDRRPFAHTAVFLLAVVLACGLLFGRRGVAVVATAVGSHQARDALRRGFTLTSGGARQTPPLPWPGYLVFLNCLAFGAFVARRGGRAAPDGPLKDHDSETDDARLARHFLEQSRAVFDL